MNEVQEELKTECHDPLKDIKEINKNISELLEQLEIQVAEEIAAAEDDNAPPPEKETKE